MEEERSGPLRTERTVGTLRWCMDAKTWWYSSSLVHRKSMSANVSSRAHKKY
jgi:hypothetical protein